MSAPDGSGMMGPPPFAILFNPMILVFFYRYGLSILFVLGLVGNLASIVTFSRPVLRATSIGCLFLLLALSDNLFLFVEIFDFLEVGIVQGPIFLENYDSLCRFRWFAKGLSQFCSAWILVVVSGDRWVRSRFPFHANRWCKRRNAFVAAFALTCIGFALHVHFLMPGLFGGLSPGIATEACGPLNPGGSYGTFYFNHWPFVQVNLVMHPSNSSSMSIPQVIFVSLIPVLLILISGMDIYLGMRRRKMRVQPVEPSGRRTNERLQRQMLLLMIASVVIFFITTLPMNLRRIAGAYEIAVYHVTDLHEIVIHTSILTVLATVNYAVRISANDGRSTQSVLEQ